MSADHSGIVPPPALVRRGARVYRIADPGAMVRAAGLVARVLFGFGSIGDGERVFTVHPVSGGISFADHGELWRNPRGRGLPDDPESIARLFLQEANRVVATDRSIARLGVTSLFPADLRPRWVGGAVARSSNVPDHFLCQFECALPVDESRLARVEGSTVDVRIGRGGRVIALRSRWRRLDGDLVSSQPSDPHERGVWASGSPFDLRAPEPASVRPIARPSPVRDAADHHSEGEDGERPLEYVYWLADEDSPQTILAPFLLSMDGHHGGFEPATAHSMWLDVMQRATADGTDLAAVVTGGSGKYEYRWTYWSPIEVFESGMRLAGRASRAHIPPGAWCVDLQVFDTMTGAFAHVERSTLGRGL